MDYFFRHEADGVFAFNMVLIRVCLVVFVGLVLKFRKKSWLLPSLLILSIFFQALLIYLYSKNRNILFIEGLPLYHCRLAGLALPLAYLIKKKKSQVYFANLAIVGTVIAFLVPDPSRFAWPHVTNLTYVVNHFLLMASGIVIGANNKTRLNFKEIIIITGSLNLFIFIIDSFLGANYGYLIEVPIEAFKGLNPFIVFFAMTGLMALAVGLVEYIKILISKYLERKNRSGLA